MKLYLIAGEASGDLHGSNLLKALNSRQPGLVCRAWGGDLMAAAGATLAKHYRDLAFMGFVEVLRNIRTILGNIAFCKKDILEFKPDALVLIDYPGFNLRIAKWAKKQGITVIYYISPQIWAWHTSRVHDIQRDVDLMLVILPFERAFYQKYGVDAVYVGHPLLDAIQHFAVHDQPNVAFPPNTIAVLPGSRVQEVKNMLPKMLSVASNFPDYQFVVAGTKNLTRAFYTPFLADYPNVQFIQGHTYELLQHATAALVKSGTSTLEAALFDVPQVVCYAGNPVSYHIAKRLIRVKYISLVNLIADKPLVRELIQEDLDRDNLIIALRQILEPGNVASLKAAYAALRQLLGEGGASKRTAEAILQHIWTQQERQRH
ncbi:MAG: hypothetical protein RIQ78_90 [Bacteroidota bacterium]|jgi:lipid-A-disaccharide synthase